MGRFGSFSAAARDVVRSVRLGFLAASPFGRKSPDLKHWIFLDSLVRIETFQWVMLDRRRRKFRAPFSAGREARGDGSLWPSHSEARACSWRKLNPVSDFLQEIVALIALAVGLLLRLDSDPRRPGRA
jgi:hypothetical protein